MTTTADKVMSPAPDLVERRAALSDDEVAAVDAWWRANNYLTVGQIYLMANPLLRERLLSEHIKPRLLGHWGTSPGLWRHQALPAVLGTRGHPEPRVGDHPRVDP